jgi:hypothetical protein
MNDAFAGYLEKLGSNFLVASMIPSLGLVVATLTVFDPILKTSDLFFNPTGIYQVIGGGVLILVPTVIIGYTLTSLNTYILKILEGYVFWRRFKRLKEEQFKRAQKMAIRRDTLRKRVDVLENWPNKTDRQKKILNRLKDQHYTATRNYDKNYPPSPSQVLPTAFGNILKAAESYPGTRYGIDGVEFWPRLRSVIPPEYLLAIDGARNRLSFLVNMFVLSFFFLAFCLAAIFYSLGTVTPVPGQGALLMGVFLNASRYFGAGLVALVFIIVFQRASLFSVGDFGMVIRSAYDLYRHDLLKQFHVNMPVDYVDEFQSWKNIGELLVLGQHNLSYVPLIYHFDDGKKQETGEK